MPPPGIGTKIFQTLANSPRLGQINPDLNLFPKNWLTNVFLQN